MTQYRIVTDGAGGEVSDRIPLNWSWIGDQCEARGLLAQLLRRGVFDESIIPLVETGGRLPDGWMKIGDQVVSAWEVWAEFDYRG